MKWLHEQLDRENARLRKFSWANTAGALVLGAILGSQGQDFWVEDIRVELSECVWMRDAAESAFGQCEEDLQLARGIAIELDECFARLYDEADVCDSDTRYWMEDAFQYSSNWLDCTWDHKSCRVKLKECFDHDATVNEQNVGFAMKQIKVLHDMVASGKLSDKAAAELGEGWAAYEP